jgi:hypothetical protein
VQYHLAQRDGRAIVQKDADGEVGRAGRHGNCGTRSCR